MKLSEVIPPNTRWRDEYLKIIYLHLVQLNSTISIFSFSKLRKKVASSRQHQFDLCNGKSLNSHDKLSNRFSCHMPAVFVK